MDESSQLTFGVEIEFVIETKQSDFDRWGIRPIQMQSPYDFFTDPRIYQLVILTMRNAGLYVKDVEIDNASPSTDYSGWTVTSDGSIDIRDGGNTDAALQDSTVVNAQASMTSNAQAGAEYPHVQPSVRPHFHHQTWAVSELTNLGWPAPSLSGMTRSGIEVKSPVLDFSEAGFAEVYRAVEALRQTLRVWANNSCGLHVHVGCRSGILPLPTLRSGAALMVTFEHQLNTLHTRDRLTSEYAIGFDNHAHFWSLSRLERVARIHAGDIDTVNQLVRLMCPNDARLAYNFMPLFQTNQQASLGTIEFRAHAGSVDAERVVAWAQLVTGLMYYAHSAPTCDQMALIQTHAHDETFDVFHLIQSIGLSDWPFVAYYARVGLSSPLRTAQEDAMIRWSVGQELASYAADE